MVRLLALTDEVMVTTLAPAVWKNASSSLAQLTSGLLPAVAVLHSVVLPVSQLPLPAWRFAVVVVSQYLLAAIAGTTQASAVRANEALASQRPDLLLGF